MQKNKRLEKRRCRQQAKPKNATTNKVGISVPRIEAYVRCTADPRDPYTKDVRAFGLKMDNAREVVLGAELQV